MQKKTTQNKHTVPNEIHRKIKVKTSLRKDWVDQVEVFFRDAVYAHGSFNFK